MKSTPKAQEIIKFKNFYTSKETKISVARWSVELKKKKKKKKHRTTNSGEVTESSGMRNPHTIYGTVTCAFSVVNSMEVLQKYYYQDTNF